jgi:hypothetical protein
VFPLRKIGEWSVIATVAIGLFAKGKGRKLLIGAVLSIVFISFLLVEIAIM